MLFYLLSVTCVVLCCVVLCWVLGVGCWVLGVGLACATRRQAGTHARRQQLACAMLGYGYGYGCGLPRAILG